MVGGIKRWCMSDVCLCVTSVLHCHASVGRLKPVPHVSWALLDVSSCRLHIILQLIFMLKVKVKVVDLFSAST